ncbi:MAG: peptidoglycan bridge formation glycyltransferase FemA/FemB family protein [Candidatus Promineifilaceae bacterium]|nr:peptidoglycan bridge formation glycyltransferase FemA/FemB family protein [Candidatus Promineifilaceae bacterium]
MLDRLIDIEAEPYTEEDAEWDAFVAAHPHGSVLQTARWAQLKSRFGWQAERVWLRQNGQLVAGAQMLVRAAALGLMRVAYVPHGPLVTWHDDEQTAVLFNQLDFAAYERGAGLLKFEPLLWQDQWAPAAWRQLSQRHDFNIETDSIQPPRTIVINLEADEDEILGRMKQKTRYNIRLAARKGVTVRQGGLDDVAIFNDLITKTSRRNEFGVHEPEYYRAAFEIFAPHQAGLFIAEYQQKPLAAIMVFVNGTRAAYLYGASSNEERQRMPTYAVQWAAIRWAKAHGCLEYDLWGVPDEPETILEETFTERNDGLWGVYRFKRGFGGELKRTVGPADRVYNRLVYRLYQWRRGS